MVENIKDKNVMSFSKIIDLLRLFMQACAQIITNKKVNAKNLSS